MSQFAYQPLQLPGEEILVPQFPISTSGFGPLSTGQDLIPMDPTALGNGSSAPVRWWNDPKIWGGEDADGFKHTNKVGMGLDALQGFGNLYLGMQRYGLAKDQLAQQKKEFGLNYRAQRKTLNTAMRDRQRARVASNPGAYQSVDAYMKQNKI